MDASTVRKTPKLSIQEEKPTKEEPDKIRNYPGGRLNSKEDLKSLISWWKIKKEELNKAKSYLGGLGQHTKMTHIKRTEEKEEIDTKYRKRENSKKTLKRDSRDILHLN